MQHPFSIRESLTVGWEKTRAHSGLVFKIALILIALGFIQNITTGENTSVFEHVVGGIATLALVVLGIGTTIISIKLVRNEPTHLRDIIPSWALVWRYLLSSLIVGIFVLACFGIPTAFGFLASPSFQGGAADMSIALGVAVGVVVGGYAMIRYSMVKFVSVDKVLDIGSILRRSKMITRGAVWHLLLFYIVIALLNILGVLLLLVGLIITLPMTFIASAYVYVKLSEQADRGSIGKNAVV